MTVTRYTTCNGDRCENSAYKLLLTAARGQFSSNPALLVVCRLLPAFSKERCRAVCLERTQFRGRMVRRSSVRYVCRPRLRFSCLVLVKVSKSRTWSKLVHRLRCPVVLALQEIISIIPNETLTVLACRNLCLSRSRRVLCKLAWSLEQLQLLKLVRPS